MYLTLCVIVHSKNPDVLKEIATVVARIVLLKYSIILNIFTEQPVNSTNWNCNLKKHFKQPFSAELARPRHMLLLKSVLNLKHTDNHYNNTVM